jgi:hypothetical protein
MSVQVFFREKTKGKLKAINNKKQRGKDKKK